MSPTSPQSSDPRSLIRYGVSSCFAITIVALWTLYLVRGTLLLLYVCALFATGLSPLVRWIERQRFLAGRQAPAAAAGGDSAHLRHRDRHASPASASP